MFCDFAQYSKCKVLIKHSNSNGPQTNLKVVVKQIKILKLNKISNRYA